MREPYPYQIEGSAFLASPAQRRSYLADEMGLGKTVQAILATRELEPHRTTVVCPASVVENWKREWEWWRGYGQLTVISYSKLIRRPVEQTELVILDEAHFCKSPGAQRTKAALKLAAGAKWAWLLSGTPMPNDPRELYPIFKYLYPDYCTAHGVTTQFKWMDRYCQWTQSDYGYRCWGTKPAARTELRPALRQIMLRRKLEDVALELPPLRTTVQYLDPDPGMAQELAELGADMIGEEHMSRMRRFLGTYKSTRIAKLIIDELNDGQYDSIIVLYHHHDTGEVFKNALANAGLTWCGFDGSTQQAQRQREIDSFQSGAGRVFLAQQGAAGTGITLTRASEIVLVEPSWSPSDNQQAIKRAHRIGQDQPVRARLFAVPDSLDEGLMNALARKSEMVEEVVDG